MEFNSENIHLKKQVVHKQPVFFRPPYEWLRSGGDYKKHLAAYKKHE